MTRQSLILIVEDNPTNARVLFDVLEAAGFRVLLAQSGESALEKLSAITPHLILLDVMMPGMDGFETCRRLKAAQATQAIPVIFMTALTETADKVKAFALGAVDYITKPIQQEEVLARVNVHLRLQTLNQELQDLNQHLEQQVIQRTVELSSALEQLQQSQLHLVNSEKMSALGQMVAGVAHEINNPVGFLTGNLQPAFNYVEDLLSLIDLYQTKYPQPDSEIEQHIETIDLAFVREDLPSLLTSMKEGIGRIASISNSLRTFSRTDCNRQAAFNLHEGLDSTLMILGHRLKATANHPEIKAVKHYGNLPLVECYPGQLNQVFMNILSNAIDALDEQNQQRAPEEIQANPSQIQIWTEVYQPGWVKVRILDNGPGLSPEARSHLFDPFFTTKPVGKGTGLGLSISSQIVTQKHGGRLYCNSTPGKGTEFVIEIPIQPSVPLSAAAPVRGNARS
ncbi:response regulator [Desertifilum sp. FACHB-1129]|uniref:histidine kinase n=1 Tax=Desertifilum tharense IPPAS B-1220 TaxID=1781255 RepID=A0A1E5QDW1_9CYAN|nr:MULTISPECIES: response regulator [Desertifilum]MDA0209064.1 response regulator [Cyanobacteria bacterium FC1]MBD2310546.1 response regulator [Desertifilum sp. FACHB-1129]MBD2321998.1 response regulator [Desertifilum sp. FACHB-866]MBD2332125.1 response regulator [Desertifilum sp. FACHB-868]OEJ72852.1 hybrid sensor histidine kinase/response regulator [Desertifilum tharense IPPAS B-1220]